MADNLKLEARRPWLRLCWCWAFSHDRCDGGGITEYMNPCDIVAQLWRMCWTAVQPRDQVRDRCEGSG